MIIVDIWRQLQFAVQLYRSNAFKEYNLRPVY